MKKFSARRVPSRQDPKNAALVPYVEIVALGQPDSSGVVLVSSNLMTAGEINRAIDDLIAELEQLRKTAKADLS